MNQQMRLLLSGIVLIFVSACAATQPASIPTGNLEELVNQLEADLTTARSDQLDVLAPGLFSDAESAFVKAKQALEQGSRLSAIGEYVAEGNASLEKAAEIAKVSRTILGETNQARDKALKVGADRLGEPFMDVEKQYLRLTTSIEKGDLKYAQRNAAKVQAAFRDVEIMAIKHNALAKARDMMAEAEKTDLPKIAPTAYSEALQALNQADAYIEQNPYATEAILQLAADAKFMARRMMTIGESSQKFQELTPEASAIYLESLLTRLGKEMKTADLRDQPAEEQLAALSEAVKSMQQNNAALAKDNAYYQARIDDLEKRMVGLQGYSREQEAAKRKLATERAFSERFDQVQHYFRPKEAEVYKQGSQLVIRLRGIQFPVGQATLKPENYTLLSKVQMAIQMFDQPTVIIEGHTDSTGSVQMNQELSQKRAEAVKTYLVANNTLPANRIRATGYGPDRPLASNSTPDGRAINRRIDVLITPANAP